ncbi:hypothetical protein [Phenylobacterium sp.]|uniref:hypothetical protein n=1 Tax=Phenylobacterium sp. TaxID=1871053 RepID=UPI0025E50CCA|nr:hypothetical protein [Phenylobacterium sp.]
MAKKSMLAVLVAGGALATGSPSGAQTADQYNRAAQAIQMCSSAMGAMIPECARLRGRPVVGAGPGAVPGALGPGKAAAAAGIFSLLSQAQAQAAPAPAATSAVNPAAIQQAIATCVQNARGNETAIQACLRIADAAKGPSSSSSLGALR